MVWEEHIQHKINIYLLHVSFSTKGIVAVLAYVHCVSSLAVIMFV